MRDVALAVRAQLQTNAGTTQVVQWAENAAFPYVWVPEEVTVTYGISRDAYEGTFNVYYRARGKQATADLAKAGDFIDGHTVESYGDARFIRYSLDSRIGPTEDPDERGVAQIVDTYTAKYWHAPKLQRV